MVCGGAPQQEGRWWGGGAEREAGAQGGGGWLARDKMLQRQEAGPRPNSNFPPR